MPANFVPWWYPAATHRLREGPAALGLSVENVVLGALLHSPQIRVLADSIAIQQTQVCQAQARFDATAFVEEKFTDTSDPVGSTLTTGGPDRFQDQNWVQSSGVRTLTAGGGRLEAAQQFGYECSNSIYFVPGPQGTARMEVSFTQPLLRGAGRAYNSSLILLADIDAHVASDQFLEKPARPAGRTSSGLFGTCTCNARCCSQKRRLYPAVGRYPGRTREPPQRGCAGQPDRTCPGGGGQPRGGHHPLRGRGPQRRGETREPGERSAVARGPGCGTDSATGSQPRRLPAGPGRRPAKGASLPAGDLPGRPADPRGEHAGRRGPQRTAPRAEHGAGDLRERPARPGGHRPRMDRPVSTGQPSYSTGFATEVPLGNRAANARFEQRRLELRQAIDQLQVATANVRAEVEIAVREVVTCYREVVSRYHAMAANEAEIAYLGERWRLLPGDDLAAGVMLDDLLSARRPPGRRRMRFHHLRRGLSHGPGGPEPHHGRAAHRGKHHPAASDSRPVAHLAVEQDADGSHRFARAGLSRTGLSRAATVAPDEHVELAANGVAIRLAADVRSPFGRLSPVAGHDDRRETLAARTDRQLREETASVAGGSRRRRAPLRLRCASPLSPWRWRPFAARPA